MFIISESQLVGIGAIYLTFTRMLNYMYTIVQ